MLLTGLGFEIARPRSTTERLDSGTLRKSTANDQEQAAEAVS